MPTKSHPNWISKKNRITIAILLTIFKILRTHRHTICYVNGREEDEDGKL